MPGKDPVKPLSQDELLATFGETDVIPDELAESALAPFPVVAPLLEPEPGASASTSRWLRWIGLMVTLFLAVQTAELVLRYLRPASAPPPAGGPLLGPPPNEFVQHALERARLEFKQRLFAEVIRVLEPFTGHTQALDPMQELEINMLLASAYRDLGDIENATKYMLRATDGTVDQRGIAEQFAAAQTLIEQGRFAEARRIYGEILARSDALSEGERSYQTLARIRLADCLAAEARSFELLAPLPGGLPHRLNPTGEAP